MSKDLGLHDPEPDDQGPGLYNGIGDVLRQARERKGFSLPDVAAHLRISEPYLAAIERGRFDQLPGRSYVLGFLRTYAAFLGLNSDKVVAQYKVEADDEFARKQQLKFPTVKPEGRTPGLWLLPLVMILAALGYLAWYGWKTDLVSFDDMVPAVPERLRGEDPPTVTAQDPTDSSPVAGPERPSASTGGSAASPSPAGPLPLDPRDLDADGADELRLAQPGARPAEAAAPLTGQGRTESRDADQAAGGPSVTADPDAPPPLPSDPVPPAQGPNLLAEAETPAASGPEIEGRSFGSDDGRVVLRASADTWVQIEDAQRNLLLTRVLKAGDSYRAPNQAGLVLMTGNAGGLILEVDGNPVPSLGPRGAVRRNVSLDPERLVDGSQVIN